MADVIRRKQRTVREGRSTLVVTCKNYVRCPTRLCTRTNPVAVYTSPVGDIIKFHDVRYHQYADDAQLHIAMWISNNDAGLSILSDCTIDVKNWYLLNGLQLNADKSEVMLVGTALTPTSSSIGDHISFSSRLISACL